MNILHIRPYIEFGGVSQYLTRLSEGLIAHGHHVIVASAGGELGDQIAQYATYYPDVPLASSTPYHLLRSVQRVCQIVNKEKVDIINTHHRFAAIVGKLVQLLTKTPLVSTMHEIKGDRGFLTRLGFGDKIIVLSEAVKQHIVTNYQVEANRISTIPMGIELLLPVSAVKRSELIKHLGLENEAPVIGCIGRLSAEKGQLYLLRAIPEVLRICPHAQFLFVGEGVERQNLEDEARRLDISSNVYFLGWRSDVYQLIDICRFIVVPSISEGFGIVLLEAYAQKKSVVATSVGNIPDLVRSQETGLLVPPGDNRSLSGAIIQLLQNPLLAEQWGQNGYEFVNANYSMHTMIKQTETLYHGLLAR